MEAAKLRGSPHVFLDLTRQGLQHVDTDMHTEIDTEIDGNAHQSDR